MRWPRLLDLKRFIRATAIAAERAFISWVQPASSVAVGIARDVVRSRTELVAENAFLRQQLIVLQRHVPHPHQIAMLLSEYARTLEAIGGASIQRGIEALDRAISLVADMNYAVWLGVQKAFALAAAGRAEDAEMTEHRVSYPFSGGHLNLKVAFTEQQGLKKKFGMAEALKLAGIDLVGVHHRGIDDARNIARLLPHSLGRKRIG